ncbi:MAG TPA: hypothetical protein ENI23_13220 [bacterium]|nr:hypothetical protein [bacterium]
MEQKNDPIKNPAPPKRYRRGTKLKRFCKVCQTKSIFNVTGDNELVCSVCGVKKTKEPGEKTYKRQKPLNT